MSNALMILHDGFEEMEAMGPIDILRRAGVDLTIASREDKREVTGKNNVTLVADTLLDAVADRSFDLLVLPGGPGTARSRGDDRVLNLVREAANGGRLIGAICAAPTILAAAGVLEGRRYTAHASVKEQLPEIIEDAAIVEDGNIITSRGAGTACEFGLCLVKRLASRPEAEAIEQAIHRLGGPAW